MNERNGKTAIFGMGKTGCSVARYLADRGELCVAFDERAAPLDLGIPLHVGPVGPDAFAGFSRVIVSPGIPWDHPALAAARARSQEVIGDLALFAEQYQGELLAVTGTNGKTTTTRLLASLLEVLPGGCESGGNIGIPMLDLLLNPQQPQRVVLELSSFQLERAPHIHPCWAVLLNIQEDHADMHAHPQAYREAKLRLFALQGDGDTAVFPAEPLWDDVADALKARGVRIQRFGRTPDADAGIEKDAQGEFLFWTQGGKRERIECARIPVLGSHQRLNLAVVAQAAADHGVSSSVIIEALTSFPGLPHRLQPLGEHANHAWYDDSKATNPDAAIAALGEFTRVLWICGGLRKGLDLAPMCEAVRRHVAHAYVIGREPEKYAEMLRTAGTPYTIAGDIKTAVELAANNEEPLPVLLSPAAASQDQFRDYAERGRTFAAAVAALAKKEHP